MSWSRRLLRSISKNRAGVITLIFALGIAAFVLVRFVDSSSDSESIFGGPPDTDPVVLDAVYADLIDAITEEGKVLYTRRVSEGRGGDPVEIEAWTDQTTYSYREHRDGEPVRIAFGAKSYSPYGPQPGSGLWPAPTCHGKFEQAVASLLQCESSLHDLVVGVVLDSRYKGTPAVAIVATGEFYGDSITHIEEHVYLDKDTMLPLALVKKEGPRLQNEMPGWLREFFTGSRRTTFEHTFVDRDSLPADFFDPASIGAVPWDPAARLERDLGIPIYWLGRESPGVQGLPSLVLDNVNTIPDWDPMTVPRRRALLNYNGPRELASTLVTMEEWAREDWDTFVARTISPERYTLTPGGLWWTWPCTERSEVAIPGGGTATVYWRVGLTHEQYPIEELIRSPDPLPEGPCLSGEPDEFLAHVEFGDTLIIVRPSGPYASREALEELVQLLRPFGG